MSRAVLRRTMLTGDELAKAIPVGPIAAFAVAMIGGAIFGTRCSLRRMKRDTQPLKIKSYLLSLPIILPL